MHITDITTPVQLARLLHTDLKGLQALAHQPGYRHFTIPKANGGRRIIETPHEPLKQVHSAIAGYLQDVYFRNRPSCSHGYIKAQGFGQRYHIVSNATAHLGCRYLVNIDLDDFFHQIDEQKVKRIFARNYFRFNRETEELLTRLVCFQKRLPMGSPTSPVLSNLAMLDADYEIENWVRGYHITYTRYVDDLSFSSTKPLPSTFRNQIERILLAHRFAINPKKDKWFDKEDTKMVTGLILTNTGLQLPLSFFKDMSDCLEAAQRLVLASEWFPLEWSGIYQKSIRQSLAGRLSLVKQVYGSSHSVYKKLTAKVNAAFKKQDNDTAKARWNYYGYQW